MYFSYASTTLLKQTKLAVVSLMGYLLPHYSVPVVMSSTVGPTCTFSLSPQPCPMRQQVHVTNTAEKSWILTFFSKSPKNTSFSLVHQMVQYFIFLWSSKPK